MIKTYILTRPYHNYSFILRHKSGASQRFIFEGGNSLTGIKARLILRSQFSQELLESSEEFKQGLVKLERVDNGGENPTTEPKKDPTPVEEVDSPEKLLEWVATELEKPYQQPKAALAYADKQGYTFPNLTLA